MELLSPARCQKACEIKGEELLISTQNTCLVAAVWVQELLILKQR